jgi:hypothetical protein
VVVPHASNSKDRRGQSGAPARQDWREWEAAAEAEGQARREAGQKIYDSVTRGRAGGLEPRSRAGRSEYDHLGSRSSKQPPSERPFDRRSIRSMGTAGDPVPIERPVPYEVDPADPPLRAPLPSLSGMPGPPQRIRSPDLQRPTIIPGMAPPEGPPVPQEPWRRAPSSMRTKIEPGEFDAMILRSKDALQDLFVEQDPLWNGDASWLPDKETLSAPFAGRPRQGPEVGPLSC